MQSTSENDSRLKHSLSLRADALDHQADIAKVQERAGHVDEFRAHIKALQGNAAPLVNQNQPEAPAKVSRIRKKGGQGAE